MSTFVVKHLITKKDGRYAYRRRVPDDVRATIGQREWKRAYPKGTTLAEAQALTIKLDDKYDFELEKARSGNTDSKGKRGGINPEAWIAAQKHIEANGLNGRRDLTGGTGEMPYTVAEHFMEQHMTEIWDEGPDGYYVREYKWDSPENEATYLVLDGGQYPEDRELPIGAMYKLDIEARDREEDKALHYAIESFITHVGDFDIRHITWSRADQWKRACQKQGQPDSTISRRAASLKAMIGRQYKRFDITKPNPFEKLGLKKGHTADQRLPFNKEHLELIDKYLKDSKVNEEVKLIMRLQKFTGARLGEISGLAVQDVKLDANVPHILIRPNQYRPLKTESSLRTVPIRAETKRAIEEQCEGKKPDAPIFSDNNRQTNNISAKVNKAIRKAGVPDSPKLCGHSFRHTMKEAMQAADVPDKIQDYLLGHSNTSVSSRYGSPARDLKKLKRELDKAIKRLGDVPEGTYDSL